MNECKIIGLKPIKKGQVLNLKRGQDKIKEISYINIAVDKIHFNKGESIFSTNLKKEMTKEEFNKLK